MKRLTLTSSIAASVATVLVMSNCTCKKPDTQPPGPGKDFPFRRMAETPEHAAKLALQFLVANGQKDSLAYKFGFPDFESLKTATLGHAMQTVQVNCHNLKNPDLKVTSLKDLSFLGGTTQILYPVVNGESTRMGIWVDSISTRKRFTHKEDKGHFTMIRMGGAETARGLIDEAKRIKDSGIQQEIVLVELPTFYQTFAAYEEGGMVKARLVRSVAPVDSACQIPMDKSLPWSEVVAVITQCPKFDSFYCVSEDKVSTLAIESTRGVDSASAQPDPSPTHQSDKSAQ